MANTDFSILLKAVLDKSGINTELKQVQEIVKKYSIDIVPELKTASLRNQMKAVSQEIANDFNKAFGINVTGNDVYKAFEGLAKQTEIAKKEQEALTAAMAKGREQAEALRKVEEKRHQAAQNTAINKSLEQEYKERQKNIEAAKRQADADRQRVATQAGKIQLQFETGGYESKVDSLIAKTQKWTDANGNARISTTNLQSELSNLNLAYSTLSAAGGNTEANQRALIEAERQLGIEIQNVTSQVTTMNAKFATDTSVQSLLQKYQAFYDKNTAAHRKWGAQIKAGITELGSGMPVTIQRAQQLEKELLKIS